MQPAAGKWARGTFHSRLCVRACPGRAAASHAGTRQPPSRPRHAAAQQGGGAGARVLLLSAAAAVPSPSAPYAPGPPGKAGAWQQTLAGMSALFRHSVGGKGRGRSADVAVAAAALRLALGVLVILEPTLPIANVVLVWCLCGAVCVTHTMSVDNGNVYTISASHTTSCPAALARRSEESGSAASDAAGRSAMPSAVSSPKLPAVPGTLTAALPAAYSLPPCGGNVAAAPPARRCCAQRPRSTLALCCRHRPVGRRRNPAPARQLAGPAAHCPRVPSAPATPVARCPSLPPAQRPG